VISKDVVLTGKARDSVTIVGMRAVVTKHEPAHDGTYSSCPTQGEIDSTGIKFDLKKTDTASATFIDKEPARRTTDSPPDRSSTLPTTRRSRRR
jgi:hypothetical protein